jgi:enamine deaminase RidA (YjgF/YER057c/UK114 family)
MPNQHFNPPGLSVPGGYSQVVIAQGSRIVYLAGQTPIDTAGNIVGEGDLGRQAEQVFANLKAALEGAGAGFSDVVKLTTYIVNLKPGDRDVVAAVRQRYWGSNPKPAATLLGVQSLARPEYRLEVEAVAVLP